MNAQLSFYFTFLANGDYIEFNLKGVTVRFQAVTNLNFSNNSRTFWQVLINPGFDEGARDFNAGSLINEINAYFSQYSLGDYYSASSSKNSLNGFYYYELNARSSRPELNYGTVKATGGFQFSFTVDGDGPGLTAAPAVTNVLCFGSRTGAITLNDSGPAGPHTYIWNDGSTAGNRSGLPAGYYMVRITDSQGFFLEYTGQITQPATPVEIHGIAYHTGCFGSANGRIEGFITGGTPFPEPHPGYNIVWNDGVQGLNRNNLRAGAYTVTVTDGNGCQKTRTFTIRENAQIDVTATITEDDVTLSVTGGSGPYTYLWSDGSNQRDRQDLQPGLYSVTITDSIACRRTVNVTIQRFEFAFSKNPVLLRLVAAEPETKPNLSFVAQLYLEPEYLSGNFTLLDTLEQPADADGSTTFDFRALLDAFLEPYLPEGKENQVSLAGSCFKRFYVRHCERYGSPAANGQFTQVDNNYVLLGGLSMEEYATRTFFTNYLPTQKPFFSWDPLEKAVFSDQPEYLYFMPNSFTLGSFRCYVRITYQDASQATYLFHTQGRINRFELWCIPAGYDQLGLAAYQPGKQIAGWELFVTDPSNVPISETRRYILRQDYAPGRIYFLWLNSLGGYNTLAAVGKLQRKLDPDAQLIEKVLQPGYRLADGEVITLSRQAQPILVTNTGHITKEYLARLEDFVISKRVILYDKGRYVGGHIAARTVTTADESETLASLDFEFKLPQMANFTPRL